MLENKFSALRSLRAKVPIKENWEMITRNLDLVFLDLLAKARTT
jgi:hypothetical protein